jgi:hypothetical protein
MALSDLWTRSQLRTAVRRELMDFNGRFWTDTELNLYLSDWQDEVNEALQFVWGTATLTLGTGTSTFVQTDLGTNILRADAFYWNNVRLIPRNKIDLDDYSPYWREAEDANPYVCYSVDDTSWGLYPPVGTSGTLLSEHPITVSFSDDASPMQVPAWTRYSSVSYSCYRAYSRFGPNYDLNRALRRKAKFERQLSRYKLLKDAHFPEKYISLRPTLDRQSYESSILSPSPYGDVSMPISLSVQLVDEVPTGTINGTNGVFTLTQDPNPDLSLKVWVDGVLLKQGSHYSLSGTTITFINPYQPPTGSTIFASYRYSS